MDSKERSAVWLHFDKLPSDTSKAKCRECGALLSRGRDVAKFSTAPLRRHLFTKHGINVSSEEGSSAESFSASANKRKKLNTSSIESIFLKRQPFASSHPVAVGITKKIAEMIALDYLPFSIVENTGFKRLMEEVQPRYAIPSRKHFTTTVIPDMGIRVRTKIMHAIESAAGPIYATTDIWTSRQNVSYMSLTAHFLSWSKGELNPTFFVLGCSQFEVAHTSAHILKEVKRQELSWGVKFSGITTDNAANVAKAMSEGEYLNIRCTSHTLNLVVKKALEDSSEAVRNVVKEARGIVAAFNRSPKNAELLRVHQRQHGTQVHELIQDMPVRWNSTFYMLERLIMLKSTINFLSLTNNVCKTLSHDEWNIAAEMVEVLGVFDLATRELSSERITLSVVLPLIRTLLNKLRTIQEGLQNDDVKILASMLEQHMKRRFRVPEAGTRPGRECYFHDIAVYEKCVLAAVLDPRVKLSWAERDQIDQISEMLRCRVDRNSRSRSNAEEKPGDSSNSSSSDDASNVGSFAFDSLEKVDSLESADVSSSVAAAQHQVQQYLRTPRIKANKCPFSFWATRRAEFPDLFEIALDHLPVQATSVSSERLFSSAGIVVSPLRNRITPANVEMLTMLHINLPRINFNY